ncbi:M20/M25/M40 family metallo-hydrolase [Hyphomicrobium sp.]|uniref:M20/M25/M40 family metallo-hydrolase n=1 Tax=Hyphomicrobium sp. TaxID=82 RepID=UPI0025B8E3E3|nr:M20/M25/M40 family metallo-hydrolase [Hyphomicrobium sp.]
MTPAATGPRTPAALFDLRTVWPRSTNRILKQIASAIGPDIDISQQLSVPSLATDIDDPRVKRVERLVQSLTGESQKPRAATFFTDGAILREAFDLAPTVLLGPGEPFLAHQTDEWCSVDRIEAACAMYKLIIEDWQRAA